MTVLWKGEELAKATGATKAPEIAITGISIDTRTLQPGDLFIALEGASHDGHDHVAEAFSKGAACCIVQRPVTASGPLIEVPDSLKALQALGIYARSRFTGKMIAITGSVGKTTTKNMLHAALATQGRTHAADKSFNNHIGVPLTLARLPRDVAWCICEIGMNHAGEIAPLAQMARPDVAIITSIGNSHIGHLGSLEAIVEEKSALFASLRQTGTAIAPDAVFGRDTLKRTLEASRARFISVGTAPTADMRLLDLQMSAEGSSFTFSGRHVALSVPGRHLAEDAALVLAGVKSVGADLDLAIAALARYKPDAGRGMRLPILDDSVTLLDESYNASGLSMRASLATLALMPAKRRIAVLGDMLEMGDHAQEAHLALLPDIVASADALYCCGAAMKHVFDHLPAGKKGAWCETADRLAPLLIKGLAAGDVVLVKGSLGSRMRDVVDALKKQGNQG
ncbi:UDP-N-acetylmuramoyl-tripeptide--D-alanyl-D-alanine ligase [Candidatus Kirkpatrickella diaphorinae]|uniref:UDP-N-acetylmuramoyl-tripeptide--D-alanyl-D-alanine ligase n=1 Tax=Candidatus Kirkpatrickella diaphorinae TaxID=2984322 RepID=A0ABY6GK32_9PROT|nr:UDP-N-acetylmuramoyl-tripeptide--D-alanyl-D-alanine ligase [Candidatus Kirkpatrickella diaphorinae]UYH51684.1 UDP-N-acetylmuramoyl-tripeptide--D-alanyl-D-alanine ligase [Candidatus Kirkpatrickella diaphorinae]